MILHIKLKTACGTHEAREVEASKSSFSCHLLIMIVLRQRFAHLLSGTLHFQLHFICNKSSKLHRLPGHRTVSHNWSKQPHYKIKLNTTNFVTAAWQTIPQLMRTFSNNPNKWHHRSMQFIFVWHSLSRTHAPFFHTKTCDKSICLFV